MQNSPKTKNPHSESPEMKDANSADNKRSSSSLSPSTETKRHKVSAPPSKVIHVRNLAPGTTEEELVPLASAFGTVTNFLLLSTKGQAFIELDSLNAATSLVSYYSAAPPVVRTRNIYFQHSTRQEIVVERNPRGTTKNKILLCDIFSMRAPITLELLERAFGAHGRVQRIVTFIKNGYHALVEMETAEQAQKALSILDGQELVPGCCILKLQYSVLDKLNVTSNNARMRDFTVAPVSVPNSSPQAVQTGMDMSMYMGAPPTLQSYSYSTPQIVHHSSQPGQLTSVYQPQPQQQHGAEGKQSVPQGEGHTGHFPSHQSDGGAHGETSSIQSGAQNSPTPNSQYGMAPAALSTQYSPYQVVAQSAYTQAPQSQMYSSGYHQAVGYPQTAYPQAMSYPQPYHQPAFPVPSAFPPLPQVQHEGGRIVLQQGGVLLVSNLNTENVTPKVLLRLFGVYGDVYRVKILYNKRDTALVQLANVQQATTAHAHLNKIEFYGKEMSITMSKHLEVQLPRYPDELTKDFSDTTEHRFKLLGSKNFKNICSPNSTLHISNIADGVSDEELTDALNGFGDIIKVQFFKSSRSMALLKMKTSDEAMQFLVVAHNTKLKGKNLKVTFSKKSIE